MTTLVYRDGILAADTQITYGSTRIPGHATKIHKLPDGSLYGFVGSLETGELMRRALLNPDPENRPDLKVDTYEGIVLTATGKMLFFEDRGWIPLKLPYIAMGSGMHYAFGALAMGATASEAVKVAMKLDGGSGGKCKQLKWKWWHDQSVTNPRASKKPVTRKRKTAH
jgi:ATP-dependent protease HslVU (ClpYQ) peptidase subunit